MTTELQDLGIMRHFRKPKVTPAGETLSLQRHAVGPFGQFVGFAQEITENPEDGTIKVETKYLSKGLGLGSMADTKVYPIEQIGEIKLWATPNKKLVWKP
jgi:hypothetical protein